MSNRRGTLRLDSLAGLLKLNHTARLFMALYLDRRVSPFLKVAAAGGMVYKFSPLDVEPDAITGISLMDDIIVSLIIMQAFIELAPDAVVSEKCERFGIDKDKVFVDVPQTIEDAQRLYQMARRYGMGARRMVQGFTEDPDGFAADSAGAPAPDTASGDTGEGRRSEPQEAADPPRYSHYSAFNPED